VKKLRIYIDNSVVGGCFDEEFAEESNALFEMAREGTILLVVSDLMLGELEPAPPWVRHLFDSMPPSALERMAEPDEAVRLHTAYIAAGIVGEASWKDALHVANATVAGADVVVSWNFKHIVNLKRIRGFNAVNIREGYGQIEIRSPKEVL